MDILERIESLCKRNGINTYSLEKELGLSHATIQKWRDHDPKATSLSKVSTFFNVSMEYLLTGQTPSFKFHGYDISEFEYMIICEYRKIPFYKQEAILDILHLEMDVKEEKKTDIV